MVILPNPVRETQVTAAYRLHSMTPVSEDFVVVECFFPILCYAYLVYYAYLNCRILHLCVIFFSDIPDMLDAKDKQLNI